MNSVFLQSVSLPAALLGASLSLIGVGWLYLCWRSRERQPSRLLLAWMLIGVSFWPWATASGFDRGPVMGALLLMLAALVVIGVNGRWKTEPERWRRDRDNTGLLPKSIPLTREKYLRGIARFMVAGPVAFFASLSIAMIFFALSSWAEANRIMTSAILVILLWPLAMVWSCADTRLIRPFCGLVLALGAGAVILPFTT